MKERQRENKNVVGNNFPNNQHVLFLEEEDVTRNPMTQ
jgi:hypothetical protein